MRLSDAIATGRLLVPELEANNIERCAIGMALLSCGLPLRNRYDTPNNSALVAKWPWLRAEFKCPVCSQAIDESQIIWHPFDSHVMNLFYGQMTLDQLIDWVRSVEPAEPSPAEVTETQAVGVAQ